MKKWYILVGVLALLGLASTAVFLILMPDRVPMHYNFAGEMDRMGSKYENLLWPGISLVLAGVLVAVSRGKSCSEKEQKIVLIMAVYTLVLFNGLSIYFMYKALRYDPAATENMTADVFRFTMLGIGVMLAVLCSLLPRMSRNDLIGVRTRWSQYNDVTWEKSQRFGGVTGVICGLLTILTAMFFEGTASLIIGSVLVLIWAVAAAIMSRSWLGKLNRIEQAANNNPQPGKTHSGF